MVPPMQFAIKGYIDSVRISKARDGPALYLRCLARVNRRFEYLILTNFETNPQGMPFCKGVRLCRRRLAVRIQRQCAGVIALVVTALETIDIQSDRAGQPRDRYRRWPRRRYRTDSDVGDGHGSRGLEHSLMRIAFTI